MIATQTAVPAGSGVKVQRSIVVYRPAEELYRFWRDVQRLPEFMTHLKQVTPLDGTHSHWSARGPLGFEVSWEAEIFNESPNEFLAWRSLPGSAVATAGSVHFSPAPGGRGTLVQVSMKFDPPGGKFGAALARLFGDSPEQNIREDLRRFKSLMEAGEIPTTEGQPSGREAEVVAS